MNAFLDILPILLYLLSGIVAILYHILFGILNFKVTKRKNALFTLLMLFFGILSIISAIVFWCLL